LTGPAPGVFGRPLGEGGLGELTFGFTGGEDDGAVSIVHNAESAGRVKVIEEGTAWKVDGR